MEKVFQAKDPRFYQLQEFREDISRVFEEIDSFGIFSYNPDQEDKLNLLVKQIQEGMKFTLAERFLDEDLFLLIDRLDLRKYFPSFPEVDFEEQKDYFVLNSANQNIETPETINGRNIIRFSKRLEQHNGECLEQAVLFQLANQAKGLTSYICGGSVRPCISRRTPNYETNYGGNHFWNIKRMHDGTYYIFDMALWYSSRISKIIHIQMSSRQYNGPVLFLIPDHEKYHGNDISPIYQIGPNPFVVPEIC